jgi:hypothetical protein
VDAAAERRERASAVEFAQLCAKIFGSASVEATGCNWALSDQH